jgi:hypothetical protein
MRRSILPRLGPEGAVTASVARAGSFRGPALIVGAGTDEAALAKQLRLLGIFVEGGIAPVALAAEAPPPEEEKPYVASKESMEGKQREEDEQRRRRHGA